MATITAYLQRATTADPGDTVPIPSDLSAVLSGAAPGEITDLGALTILTNHVSSSFVPSNIMALQSLFVSMDDVAPDSVEVVRAWFVAGDQLPMIDVQASFEVAFRQPITDEELDDWQEDNDEFLTDCVSFWWCFGGENEGFDGVLGCEEAGAYLDD